LFIFFFFSVTGFAVVDIGYIVGSVGCV